MFGKMREFFSGEEDCIAVDKSGMPSNEDLQVATAVLLVEMASADKEIDQKEAEAVCVAMKTQFGIEEETIPELVQVAIAARKEQEKIDDFVKLINDNFNNSQRQRILAMVWKVVLADGRVDDFETRFAEQLRNRFKLSPSEAEMAREMAQQGSL